MTILEERVANAIINMAKAKDEPDYKSRLMHQASIAAMQGIISNESLMSKMIEAGEDHQEVYENVAEKACGFARALIAGMK